MPDRPTILFAAFRSSDDPLRRSWMRHLGQLDRVAVTRPVEDVAGIWRLLASNNREIGRSATSYRSFAEARDHVLALQQPGMAFAPVVVADKAQGFAWWLDTEGDRVLVSARWYPTASLARESVRAARTAFASATVAELPLRTTNSGRRTSRVASRQPERLAW